MSWTKEKLIRMAFTEIGLGNSFNVTPTHLSGGLDKLDAMMTAWGSKGIRLGYALSSDPDTSDIAADSGIPDTAYEAVYLNLALRLAPVFGKTLAPTTMTGAREAYDALIALAAFPPQQRLPNTLPIGAGNKPWRYFRGPFVLPETPPLLAEQGGDQIDFE